MEPTIYKPGAHKTPGVYNGPGGVYKGRGVYNDSDNVSPLYYYTLFENFDFATKIDYPIIGEPTQYDTANNYTYTNDSLIYDGEEYHALNLKSSSSAITRYNLIPLQINSYIEFIGKINMVSSSAPVFVWTTENFGFYVDWNKANRIGILSPSGASDYEMKNGTVMHNVSYGVRWFLTTLQNDAVFKFRIDYLNEKTICSVDGVEYVVFNTTNANDTNLLIDPRMNNNLSITDVKCYLT